MSSLPVEPVSDPNRYYDETGYESKNIERIENLDRLNCQNWPETQ
jgi:hypothetical protein